MDHELPKATSIPAHLLPLIRALEQSQKSQAQLNQAITEFCKQFLEPPSVQLPVEQRPTTTAEEPHDKCLGRLGANFNPHYYTPGSKGLDFFIGLIANSVTQREYIHNWDRIWISDPVSALAAGVAEAAKQPLLLPRDIRAYGSVDHVYTINGNCQRKPLAINHLEPAGILFSIETKNWASDSRVIKSLPVSSGPKENYGRVIFIKDHKKPIDRAAMLLLFCYSLRLKNEDDTFIRNFIARHLSHRCALKWFGDLQDISPSVGSGNVSYRRVTLSFHIPHLLFQRTATPLEATEVLDRERLGGFELPNSAENSKAIELWKSSSSVLLTLVTPERTRLRGEAHELLSNPESLWSVVIVNAPHHLAQSCSTEPSQHLTPIAQFIRGVYVAIYTKRCYLVVILWYLRQMLHGKPPAATEAQVKPDRNMDDGLTITQMLAGNFQTDAEGTQTPTGSEEDSFITVQQMLKEYALEPCSQGSYDDDDTDYPSLKRMVTEGLSRINDPQPNLDSDGAAQMFDDPHFSKSIRYHRLLQMCHKLHSLINTCLKHTRGFSREQLPALSRMAHKYERIGIEYWSDKLKDELTALELVSDELNGLRMQVLELREALHGMTAILETREAVRQGETIRLLTYLTMCYLPIASVSAIYSMSVLPQEATLVSFFVVLIVFAVITAALVLYVRQIKAAAKFLSSFVLSIGPLARAIHRKFESIRNQIVRQDKSHASQKPDTIPTSKV